MENYLDILFGKGQIPGGASGYKTMINQTPVTAEEWGDKIARIFSGGADYEPKAYYKKPVVNTPNVASNIGKKAGTLAKYVGGNVGTTAKAVGGLAKKSVPLVSAAGGGYDIYNNIATANKMKEINKVMPGTFSPGAIKYYEDKAKVLGTGAAIGTVGGGVLGSGVFSLPGAGIGMGAGTELAKLGYWLANVNNPNANVKITPEIQKQFKAISEQSKNNNNKQAQQQAAQPSAPQVNKGQTIQNNVRYAQPQPDAIEKMLVDRIRSGESAKINNVQPLYSDDEIEIWEE